jgi:hypothetical protein
MNRKKDVVIVCALVMIAFAGGCTKEKKEENKVVGTWKKVKEETRLSGGSWEDVNEPCQLDNVEEYQSNGNYTVYPGADLCSPSESTITGTWRSAANNTKIIYTYSGYSDEFESTIEELTNTSMVITHATGTISGAQIRDTYQKQ